MTVPFPPICVACVHLQAPTDNLMTCEAYGVIPGVIVFNILDHRQPLMGDRGAHFEQDPDHAPLDHERYDVVFKAQATACATDDSSSPASRHARLNRRLRLAFVEGAEEDSLRRFGRGLTAEELERVLWRYPGDAADRREP